MSKMKFIDLPVGARFIYPDTDRVFVKLNSHPKSNSNDGRGLICSWHGDTSTKTQEFCCFADEEEDEGKQITLNDEVEVLQSSTSFKEVMKKLKSVELYLLAHPDNEEDSECADRISDLQDVQKEILALIATL
jgi:hypothetical protein